MSERHYARKFLRIKPDIPMYADLSIVQVGVRSVVSGATRVRIIDISPGGLRFVSSLNFPVDKPVLLKLDFMVEGQVFCIKGHITNKLSSEVHENEYGFCFHEPDETLRLSLKRLFNHMSVRLQRHIVILRLG